MSCGLVLASISLNEERKKRQQINKKKETWSCFFLPLHPTHFEAVVRRMSKIQCSLFIYLSVKYFFFPRVQMETNVWWHIWGTLKWPGKKGRAKIEVKKREERKEMGVSLQGCVCVCMSVCLLAEDCADVHAAAGLTHYSTCLKKKGFSPLCFKYHRPSKWARTCLQNK